LWGERECPTVSELMMDVAALKAKGFHCAQIIVLLGLRMLGKENPDLVRAMHGFTGGLGRCGRLCGCLAAGLSLFGLYAGKGTEEESEDPMIYMMAAELGDWFRERFGSDQCCDLTNNDPDVKKTVCPPIMEETFAKVLEILESRGYDPEDASRPAGGPGA
jgi:C_GCAxxG_C_C family probable redox protein